MKYIELKNDLGAFTVFGLSDIRIIDGSFDRRRISEWCKKGYIRKLSRGKYIFSDLKLDENVLFEIANRLYATSYVSFEAALSYYGLIPETVYGITSASTRRTYRIDNDIAEFSYRNIRKDLFWGYNIVKNDDKCFKIASLEKAVLDHLYLNKHIAGEDDFRSLRIDRVVFFEKVDLNKFDEYRKRFKKKAFSRRVKMFLEVMKNA
ncbi:MAG: hypothetical protein HQL29_04855 [Candidatus Omnitrophica bacterium]|nr:hypothetical protein [Candidatus Omnitrophota bacterium]